MFTELQSALSDCEDLCAHCLTSLPSRWSPSHQRCTFTKGPGELPQLQGGEGEAGSVLTSIKSKFWVLSAENLGIVGKWYLDFVLGLIVLCPYRICFGFPHPHISTNMLQRVTTLWWVCPGPARSTRITPHSYVQSSYPREVKTVVPCWCNMK